jgi:hypothetical protein
METLPEVIYACIISKGQTNIPELACVCDTEPIKFRCTTPTMKIDRYGNALNPVPYIFRKWPGSFGLAVDNHAPSPANKKSRYILGRGLKAPVICGDTMGSKYANGLSSMLAQSHGHSQISRLDMCLDKIATPAKIADGSLFLD